MDRNWFLGYDIKNIVCDMKQVFAYNLAICTNRENKSVVIGG
jgi:hypothetical protein